MLPKLKGFLEIFDRSESLPPGMLGAFAASFTWEESAEALVCLLDAEASILQPIRNRVLRLAQEAPAPETLIMLTSKLLSVSNQTMRMRRRSGTILASLFPFLPVKAQSEVITNWKTSHTVE